MWQNLCMLCMLRKQNKTMCKCFPHISLVYLHTHGLIQTSSLRVFIPPINYIPMSYFIILPRKAPYDNADL